jgi:hypothetical protein
VRPVPARRVLLGCLDGAAAGCGQEVPAVTRRRQARQLARDRRRHESSLLRMMVPQPLTAEQRRLLLRRAHRVRLRDGTLLSSALGR